MLDVHRAGQGMQGRKHCPDLIRLSSSHAFILCHRQLGRII